jgi:hypothetical protein
VIPLDMCTREESEDDDDRVSLLDAGRANTQHRNMAKMRITMRCNDDFEVLERPAVNSHNCWPYFHARIKGVVAQ